jgi:hypothetical protein
MLLLCIINNLYIVSFYKYRMTKFIIYIFGLLFGCLFVIQSSFALDTYVGIEIMNLTDDSIDTSNSCNNQAGGYGSQGRMRALSSILPDYPIYFSLTYDSNGSIVWQGNSTDDGDFIIGDTMYLPNLVNMQSGVDYRLIFDIDAIRIYLPLVDFESFEKSVDDNYWTVGEFGGSSYQERAILSSSCSYSTTLSAWTGVNYGTWVSNNRVNLSSDCNTDSIAHNCDELGLMAIGRGGNSFKINGQYTDLYQPTIGIFEFVFTFP